MGQPTTRQQAETLLNSVTNRDDKVEIVEKFINLTIAAAKRDLAEKVLAAVDAERALWDRCVEINPHDRDLIFEALDKASKAVQRVFAQSGIELTTTQQQEGE